MATIHGWGRRRSARVFVAGLVMAVAALTAAPSAHAQSTPDLGSIVIGNLAGYELAVGTGLSGPLTMEEFAQLGMSPDEARALAQLGVRTHARSFVGSDGQVAVIIAFDYASAFKARIFAERARKRSANLGPAARVSGLDDAFRVDVPPDKAAGMSAQEVYFRSGQLGFYISMLDHPSSPVTEAKIMEVARAQAAVVPAGVGRAGEGAAKVGITLGRMLFVVIALALVAGPIVLLVLLVVVFTRRAQRRAAPAPQAPQPPATLHDPWI